MLSNSLKMMKIHRNMSELWQIVCKNIVLTLVHLLILLYEIINNLNLYLRGLYFFIKIWTKVCPYSSCKWLTWRTIPFSTCLFQFCTCFEQPRAHHQENQLYQYNLWYVSLCVGDRLLCRPGRNFPTCILDGQLQRLTHTRGCTNTIDSTDDEHEVARKM
jgi:hypothetical protein